MVDLKVINWKFVECLICIFVDVFGVMEVEVEWFLKEF